MKEKKLFDAITNVDDQLIEEAGNSKLKSKRQLLMKFVPVAACLVVLVAAGWFLSHPQHMSSNELVDVILPKSYAFDDWEAKHAVLDQNPVEDAFISAVQSFSYNTASKLLATSETNINYSPLSLYFPLSLAATGAKGETQTELMTLLGVEDANFLSKQCGNLYRQLYTDNEIGQLKIANSLWIARDFPLKQEFANNAAKNFYTSSFQVDFKDQKTGTEMGKWVSNQTNNVLAPQIEVSPSQILSILNTIYFTDEWIDRFSPSATKSDEFKDSQENVIICDFMNSIRDQAFARGNDFTRASLSLKNGNRMVFILPDEGVSPQDLVATPQTMKEAFEGGEGFYGPVTWKVPKFSFDSKLKLKDTLSSLGVNLAFMQDADFKEMTDEQAFISQISQQTHIAVNEKGVEAASFTQIDYAGSAMPKEEAYMILNRPFLYGICAGDGTLLFVGICENPVGEK